MLFQLSQFCPPVNNLNDVEKEVKPMLINCIVEWDGLIGDNFPDDDDKTNIIIRNISDEFTCRIDKCQNTHFLEKMAFLEGMAGFGETRYKFRAKINDFSLTEKLIEMSAVSLEDNNNPIRLTSQEFLSWCGENENVTLPKATLDSLSSHPFSCHIFVKVYANSEVFTDLESERFDYPGVLQCFPLELMDNDIEPVFILLDVNDSKQFEKLKYLKKGADDIYYGDVYLNVHIYKKTRIATYFKLDQINPPPRFQSTLPFPTKRPEPAPIPDAAPKAPKPSPPQLKVFTPPVILPSSSPSPFHSSSSGDTIPTASLTFSNSNHPISSMSCSSSPISSTPTASSYSSSSSTSAQPPFPNITPASTSALPFTSAAPTSAFPFTSAAGSIGSPPVNTNSSFHSAHSVHSNNSNFLPFGKTFGNNSNNNSISNGNNFLHSSNADNNNNSCNNNNINNNNINNNNFPYSNNNNNNGINNSNGFPYNNNINFRNNTSFSSNNFGNVNSSTYSSTFPPPSSGVFGAAGQGEFSFSSVREPTQTQQIQTQAQQTQVGGPFPATNQYVGVGQYSEALPQRIFNAPNPTPFSGSSFTSQNPEPMTQTQAQADTQTHATPFGVNFAGPTFGESGNWNENGNGNRDNNGGNYNNPFFNGGFFHNNNNNFNSNINSIFPNSINIQNTVDLTTLRSGFPLSGSEFS